MRRKVRLTEQGLKDFENDESWKAKRYQDERDKFLTNPNYVGTSSIYDPMNYREVEDFVDDEEDGSYKDWMDEVGYEGVTNNDSIYNIKGDFYDLANKQREHLLNRQTKPWLHNESKMTNKKLIRLTEGDLHRIVKESVKRILNERKPLYTNGDAETAKLGSDAYDDYVYHYDNNGNKVRHNWETDIRDKHNQRTWKHIPQRTSLQRDTEELLPMLRDLGISVEDWRRMSTEEKQKAVCHYEGFNDPYRGE